MNKDEFLSRLPPKMAKEMKTASEVEITRIPTASRRLNLALGGGVALGMVTTIYGTQSAGKSLLSLQSVGGWQRQGLLCGWADVEGTFDKDFAQKLGVDNDELFITGSKSSGRLTNEIIPWIEAGIDVLVIDSISDILPEVFVDTDGTIKDSENTKQIGAHAKAITALINAIHYANHKTAVILLSQTTTKMETWGTVQVPHGGQKTLFGSSQMISLTSSNTDKEQKKGLIQIGPNKIEQPIGRSVKASVKKNKLGRQSTVAEYDIYYAGDFVGVDQIGELVDLAVDFNVVDKGGAWYKYAGDSTQGRDDFIKKIRDDETLRLSLESELDAQLAGQ